MDNLLNISIYTWLVFLIFILVVAILLPLFKTGYSLDEQFETKFKNKWTNCIDCCNQPKNYDFEKCIINCAIEGNSCYCCDLHYKKKRLERDLKFYSPTVRDVNVSTISAIKSKNNSNLDINAIGKLNSNTTYIGGSTNTSSLPNSSILPNNNTSNITVVNLF